MTDKTVSVELKIRPKVTVVLTSRAPESKPLYEIEFKKLKQNQLSKISIDWSKNFEEAKVQVMAAVLSIKSLCEEAEEVLLEDLVSGDVYPELAAAVLSGFVDALVESTKDDEKKNEAPVTDSAQG